MTLSKILRGGVAIVVSLAVSHTSMAQGVRQAATQLAQRQTGTLTKQMHTTPKRQLAPQVKALLDQISATYGKAFASAPNSPAGQLEANRQGYRGLIPFAGPPEQVFNVKNRLLPGPAGKIPVRIYTPRAGGNLPVLVFFHGGGFTAGDLDTHDASLRALANRAGCMIISVAYRLAPEHPFPAAPEDAYTAIKWVAEHAKEIGGDPTRIAVGGDSAGGTLATVVAMMARDRGGPALVYQVLLYPNTDATNSRVYPSWQENDGIVLTKASNDSGYAQYLPTDVDRKNPYVSPLWAENLKHLPPALVVTGEFDPLRDEGEAYAARLKQAGVSVVATRYNGMIHGFFQFARVLYDGKMVIEQTAAALRAN